MSIQTVLLLVGAFLVISLLAAVVVLRLESRQKQLEQRIDLSAGAGRERQAQPDRAVSIRASRPRRPRLSEAVYSFLRIPVGIPLANVVPVWLVFVIAGAVGLGASWVLTILLPANVSVLVGVVAALLAARGIFSWERGRYSDKLLQQMPDAIEVVVSALRAGLPIVESFRGLAQEMPSPTREEFTQMVSEMSLGTPPEDALMATHHRTDVGEYAIFAVTVAVQMRTGGKLTESIQNLAEVVRQRLAVGQRANALAAEAKLAARVISVLPFVGGLLMNVMQPGSMGPLLHDPIGKKMLAVGAITLVLGMITMRSMIRGVTNE